MMPVWELLASNPSLFISVCAVLGAVVGSFLNVVIYRLPKMMARDWLRDCVAYIHEFIDGLPANSNKAQYQEPLQNLQKEPLFLEKTAAFNLLLPSSSCPHCQHKIRAWENIPVLGYLMLRGRCSGCAKTISPRYPIIEAVCAGLSAYVAMHFGFGWFALAGLFIVWTLLTLTMIDIDTQYLPDDITLPLMWCGLLFNLFGGFVDLRSAVIGAAAGYLSLWSVYWAFKLIRGKEGMGYGDFKLLAALGAWFGWQMLPLIILSSSLVGAVVGISLIVISKQGWDVKIPFGPYLAGGGLIALFWGQHYVHFYLP